MINSRFNTVPASCTVDPLISGRLYRVNVTGGHSFMISRSYVIHERTEDAAAREGLRAFHGEFASKLAGAKLIN